MRAGAQEEDAEAPHGCGERGSDAPGAPAPRVRLDEAERDPADARSEKCGAAKIGKRAALCRDAGEHSPPGKDGGDPDRHVHDEHPAPARLNEQPAEHGACCSREPARRSPHTHRAGAALRGVRSEHEPE